MEKTADTNLIVKNTEQKFQAAAVAASAKCKTERDLTEKYEMIKFIKFEAENKRLIKVGKKSHP